MGALFSTYDPTLTLIIGGSIIGLATLVAAMRLARRDGGFPGIAAILLGLVAISLVYFVTESATDDSEAAARTAQTEWVESHGISLTEGALDDLKFPENRPDGDEDYGIAQVVRDEAIVDVHLAWKDDEFVLYGTDGQPLEAIE